MTPPALGIADDASRARLCDAAEVGRELQRRPDPKTIAVTTASAVLNSSTGRFISMTDSAANELVGTQATINARPFQAIRTPSAAPATAITSASVRSCCTMDSCGAKADRTASSCWRCAPRTSSRIETLAQPTSSSDVTAPSSRRSRGPIGRANSSMMRELNTERVGVAARCLCGKLLQDGLQFGIGLRDGHARAYLERHAVVDIGLEPDLERHVNVRFAPAKSRRHDADDLIVLANELQRPADHGGVARVIPLPELIAQHHDARRVLTRGRQPNRSSPHERGLPQ